jgi:hypothetical protein
MYHCTLHGFSFTQSNLISFMLFQPHFPLLTCSCLRALHFCSFCQVLTMAPSFIPSWPMFSSLSQRSFPGVPAGPGLLYFTPQYYCQLAFIFHVQWAPWGQPLYLLAVYVQCPEQCLAQSVCSAGWRSSHRLSRGSSGELRWGPSPRSWVRGSWSLPAGHSATPA